MKNNQQIKRDLVQLITENPDLPIVAVVDGEICDDDYSWYFANVNYVTLGEYTVYYDECIDDRDFFKERYFYNNSDLLCEKFNYDPSLYIENNESGRKLENYLDQVSDTFFHQAIMIYLRPFEE